MTWSLGPEPGVHRLIEYEAKLNHFFPENNILAICRYNRARFSPEVIEDVIETHPLVIFGATVCRNFYYVPPEEFLGPEKKGLKVERLLQNILERERAEEALRDSEEKCRKIIEGANDAVVVVDVKTGVILEANRLAGELTGTPSEKLRGLHFSKILPQEKFEEYSKGFREAVQKGEARGEAYLLHASGSWVPVEVSASTTVIKGRDVIFGIIRDVTERKSVEAALRESEEKYRKIIETAFAAIFIVDIETEVILEANKRAGELLGVPPDKLTGLHFTEIHPKEKAEEYTRRFRESVHAGRGGGELYVLHSGGRWIPVEVRSSTAEIAGRNVRIGFFMDITERKKADEALKKSEERLKEAQNVASIGSWEWDIVENDLWWSDEIYVIFGLAHEKFGATYEAFLNAVHPADRDFVIKSVDEALYVGKPYSIDHRIVLPDGTVRVVHEMGRAYFGSDGKPLRMLGTVQDVTERRKAEEAERKAAELERVNRELEQFAMVASHDLKEPLRIISGYMDLLLRRHGTHLGEDAKEFVGYAVAAARRMQRLIDDLLSYSRAGTLGDLAPVDSETAVKNVLFRLKPLIEETGAQVTSKGLPVISGNALRLEQLFQNLISNAIKYRGESPPRIHISASKEDGDFIFSVRDNGRGIDPVYLKKIFEIFFHIGEPDSGTGIGLAICKRIVEGHGGHIWVESVQGNGSTFYFTIPDRG